MIILKEQKTHTHTPTHTHTHPHPHPHTHTHKHSRRPRSHRTGKWASPGGAASTAPGWRRWPRWAGATWLARTTPLANQTNNNIDKLISSQLWGRTLRYIIIISLKVQYFISLIQINNKRRSAGSWEFCLHRHCRWKSICRDSGRTHVHRRDNITFY